ncbi:MAG TPA: hypothetical protein VG454_03675 [Gemmatimonadales bacterium]|nr:hypothetical protein [Gemmatimonadales bacterium]
MRPWRFVLTGGVVAGTLDIVYAIVFWAIKRGVAPERILQRVAAGVLGSASMTDGWASAALGLFFQYFIAIAMAVAYFLVARRWSALWQRPLLYGAVYGLLLYFIMNYIVVPLSAAGPGSKDPLWIALSIAVHALCVGIPCAIFARLAIQADTKISVTAV